MALILIILFGIVGAFCLYLAIACLLAASRENTLPDFDDIEIW